MSDVENMKLSWGENMVESLGENGLKSKATSASGLRLFGSSLIKKDLKPHWAIRIRASTRQA